MKVIIKELGIALLLGLLIVFGVVEKGQAAGVSLTEVYGQPLAPDMVLTDLNGEEFRLLDHRGKGVLVNFWATWCPPCVREMPAMQRLQEKLANRPFLVVAVDVGEDEDAIWAFAAEYDLDFPILLDKNSKEARMWGARGLPTTFLVDWKGHIIFRALGGRAWDDPKMLQKMEQLMPPTQ